MLAQDSATVPSWPYDRPVCYIKIIDLGCPRGPLTVPFGPIRAVIIQRDCPLDIPQLPEGRGAFAGDQDLAPSVSTRRIRLGDQLNLTGTEWHWQG